MNFLRFLLCSLAVLTVLQSQAAEYPPQDHAGGNLILANGDVIWGVHTNVNRFEIPTSSTTVLVKPYDGVTTDTNGMVEIQANIIEINGTLDATAAGYTGGGGGGGGEPGTLIIPPPSAPGAGGVAPYGGGAFDGGDGGHPSGGFGGSGGAGAAGDGEFGGAGGIGGHYVVWPSFVPGQPGEDGGYAAPASNGDDTIDESTRMGSGGGGSGGQKADDANATPPYAGSGGDAGGRGGGMIRLFAANELTLGADARILANGALGGDGSPYSGLLGGAGGDVEGANSGSSPAGAGGGILIDVRDTATVNVAAGATIESLGGNDAVGAGGSELAGVPSSNGGSVKIFYDPPTNPFSGATISGGRVTGFPTNVEHWMEY